MPDRRRHRGMHPQDRELFSEGNIPILRQGVHDLSYFLTRGYAIPSALKIVGDRYQLRQRQRLAVMRSSCSNQDHKQRKSTKITPKLLVDQGILLDGYNILTTVETALSGGVILVGRDGCCRDIVGMHGTFRHVQETLPAAELIGAALKYLKLSSCIWYLDKPVSNSGLLKMMLEELAGQRGWNWQVELAYNPDRVLAETDKLIATSDGEILNCCQKWFNLTAYVIRRLVKGSYRIVLD